MIEGEDLFVKIQKLALEQSIVSLSKPFKTSLRAVTEIEVIRVTLQLADGVAGYGAAAPTWAITGDSLASIRAALNGPIHDAVIGREIESFEDILVDVDNCCVGNSSAKAAADIALHDLYARFFKMPLYQLLGGQNSDLETDITIGIDEPSEMRKEAAVRVAEGFKVLKIKVGHEQYLDIERIEAIHEAVGNEVLLRLDANQGWNRKQAVRIIQTLEDRGFGIELVEQPVPAHDIEGLKFVTERVNTPIMADESVFSARDALRLLQESAVDLLNIKLMKCGGIRNARQIAAVAEAAGVQCMIGSMMEPGLSVAAAAHVGAAHANITRYDLDAPLWLKDDSLQGGVDYDGSVMTLSGTPGLGMPSHDT